MSKFPENKDHGKPGEGTSGNTSDSKITTPEEDQKKVTKLYSIIDGRISDHVAELKEVLLDHGQKIQSVIDIINKAAEQPQQTQEQGKIPTLADRPELMTGLAQIIQAWKGNDPKPSDDYFSQMSKNITLNMLQAGVDGIMKNVYDNYNPAAPNSSIINRPTNPTAQHTRMT